MSTTAQARPVPGDLFLPSRPRSVVLWACVAVVVARLSFLTQPLRSDEGGYLFVARHWRAGGEFLYGDYHVDRPPLLMAIFRIAALSEWDGAIRLLSIPFALAAVLAVARAAYVVAGDRAAGWAAVVAAALLSSPALAADQADGELFAAPFVAGAAALALDSWRRPAGRTRWWLAVGAGVLGGAASLVKQNFLEGLVFVAALVVVDGLRSRRVTRRAWALAGGALLGALLPNLATYLWARSAGLGGFDLWTDLAAFREDAFGVIWAQRTARPVGRAVALLALGVLSGLVPLAWTWLRACLARRGDVPSVEWACGVGLVFATAAIAAGGSYWPHYLIELVPLLALLAGLVAGRPTQRGRVMQRWCRVAAVSSAALVLAQAVVYQTIPWLSFQERVGEWLAESSEPGDTALVAYGSPSILEAADLTTPYPYLWSLPMRTLDPEQRRLRSTLAGPDAPTWIVEANGLNSWRIDRSRELRDAVEARYDKVGVVCGLDVWLRSDLTRSRAPLPSC